MPLDTTSKRRRLAAVASWRTVAAVLAVGSLGVIYLGQRPEGFAVLVLSAVGYRIGELTAQRRRLRERLRGRRVIDVSCPVVRVGARDPLDDIRRIRAVGAGVVRDGESTRVVLPRDINDLTLPEIIAGRWDGVGRPAPRVDGWLDAGDLSHLPRDGEVRAVAAGDLTVGVLTAAGLEQAVRQRSDDASDDDAPAPGATERPLKGRR
jgi:hypothetical protein